MNPVCILRISVRSDSARRWFQKEVRNSVFLYLGPFPAKRVQSDMVLKLVSFGGCRNVSSKYYIVVWSLLIHVWIVSNTTFHL